MKVSFHPEVKEELLETIDFYETQAISLGKKFLKDVELASVLITNFPELGRPFSTSTISKLLKKFPYRIVYQIINEEELRIAALMHLRRKPGYWKKRISP